MAIEIGLLLLVNGGISSPPFTGGYLSELPTNASYPSYVLRWISEPENLALQTNTNLKYARVEFRCYGDPQGNGADAIDLAASIKSILTSGFIGLLPDPSHTSISSIFKTDQIDLSIDPNTRAYRRMVEFSVNYW